MRRVVMSCVAAVLLLSGCTHASPVDVRDPSLAVYRPLATEVRQGLGLASIPSTGSVLVQRGPLRTSDGQAADVRVTYQRGWMADRGWELVSDRYYVRDDTGYALIEQHDRWSGPGKWIDADCQQVPEQMQIDVGRSSPRADFESYVCYWGNDRRWSNRRLSSGDAVAAIRAWYPQLASQVGL
jgi:hypothetical protein